MRTWLDGNSDLWPQEALPTSLQAQLRPGIRRVGGPAPDRQCRAVPGGERRRVGSRSHRAPLKTMHFQDRALLPVREPSLRLKAVTKLSPSQERVTAKDPGFGLKRLTCNLGHAPLAARFPSAHSEAGRPRGTWPPPAPHLQGANPALAFFFPTAPTFKYREEVNGVPCL